MTRSLSKQLLMFAWLTVGYAMLHLVVGGWLFSILNLMIGNSSSYEHVQVLEDDGPVIQSSGGGSSQVTFRRLDGAPLTGARGNHAQGITFRENQRGESASWNDRIVPFIDFQTPMVNWYLVLPPDHHRTTYFVGYEQLSRRLVGYLGTQGFSSNVPPLDQSFPLQAYASLPFLGQVASIQQSNGYYQPYEPSGGYYSRENMERANAAVDIVWILSNGSIYEVRLADRTVRKLIENRPELEQLSQTTITRDGQKLHQLVAWTPSGLVFIDPQTLEEHRVSLPSTEPGTYFELKDGRRFFVTHHYSHFPGQNHQVRIVAIAKELSKNGNYEIEEQIDLELSAGEGSRFIQGLGLVVPVPVVALSAGWFAALETGPELGLPTSYLGRVAFFYRLCAMWLLIALTVGIATGWAVRRRETDVFQNSGWFWPILVGMCGWFGWMGYICLRPLPARLPHRSWLPAQPEPNRPLGTEIFA